MEERVLLANLAILNPMEKMICCSGMRIEIYSRAAPIIKIGDPMIQDSSLSKQKTK